MASAGNMSSSPAGPRGSATGDRSQRGQPLKIAVLFGGTSAERDVSIASGAQVVQGLRDAGHEVVACDTVNGVLSQSDEVQLLSAGVSPVPPGRETLALLGGTDPAAFTRSPELEGVALFFLTLHGGDGEDGTLQALLDMVGRPYTGSGPLASAVAMDKDLSKRLFRYEGVPTADWLMAPASEAEVEAELGWPVVVKPSKQGSSVGLTVVTGPEEYQAAVELAAGYDDEVMIERYVPGREITVPVLGGEALPPGEIIPKNAIFDYECKYQPGMAEEIFPADLTPDQARTVQEMALRAHRALKLRNYSRVDFRLDEEGNFWCLEANTAPGMTSASLFPKGALAAGIDFPAVCDRIARLALEEHQSRRRG